MIFREHVCAQVQTSSSLTAILRTESSTQQLRRNWIIGR